MIKPLEFIANNLSDLLSRTGSIRTAVGMDAKRPRAWEEYGYPDEVSFDQLYLMWRRGGMAHGAVERLIDKCWSNDPWLLEGTEKADDWEETPLEAQWRRYAQAVQLWTEFSRADRMRLVGGCSALLLEAPGKWSEPVRRGAVTGVRAVWRNQLKALTRDTVTERVRTWEYKTADGKRTATVHPDRVYLLGDWNDPLSFIEPAYNFLVNLDKICGGAGEGFLKNASRQLALEFGEGGNLQQLATSMGKQPEEVHEVLNDMAKDLNSGIDALFAMSGGKVTPIVASMPDASAPFDINAMQAAAAWRIPMKVLLGNQTGERASTEDQKEFNTLCQSRNRSVVYPEIREFFRHLERIRAIDALPQEWTVYGDDLTEAGTVDKLANAKTMAEINKLGEIGGVTFTADEIRTAADYDAAPDGLGETE